MDPINTEPTKTLTGHSPGPWVVCGWKNVMVNLPCGDTMALAMGPKNAPLAEMQANALLVAAAPTMLIALERLQANPNDPYAHRLALDALKMAGVKFP